MIYLLVAFFATAVVAVPWTLWARYVAEKKRWHAGAADAVIYLFTGAVTASIIHDRWCLVASALGAFVGTVVAVKPDEALPQ